MGPRGPRLTLEAWTQWAVRPSMYDEAHVSLFPAALRAPFSPLLPCAAGWLAESSPPSVWEGAPVELCRELGKSSMRPVPPAPSHPMALCSWHVALPPLMRAVGWVCSHRLGISVSLYGENNEVSATLLFGGAVGVGSLTPLAISDAWCAFCESANRMFPC